MKLVVVFIDSLDTQVAIQFYNDHVPLRRRLVTLDLTPDQVRRLESKSRGSINDKPVFEEISHCWLESEEGDVAHLLNADDSPVQTVKRETLQRLIRKCDDQEKRLDAMGRLLKQMKNDREK